jgi:hypothetical protein
MWHRSNASLGTTVRNQNLIQEEIKRRLNSGNVCYHSVHNISSSRLLSKNVKIRIILPMVLNGRETWSLILKEEYRLRAASQEGLISMESVFTIVIIVTSNYGSHICTILRESKQPGLEVDAM